MISESTQKAAAKFVAARETDAAKAQPVRFNVLAPLFFRGEAFKRGDVITASLEDAVELFGSFRAEIERPMDVSRIRDAIHEASAHLAKEARRTLPGWVKTGRF
jgi:hypothetical protein